MEEFLARLKTSLFPLPKAVDALAEGGVLRHSAVLVPIVLRDEAPAFLFTRRADHLRSHAGQVSFPGGRIEASDATPGEAALREAYEEIGLESRFVTLQGALPAHETGTGFLIHPVVGLVQPGFSLAIDSSEVADVFEVPVSFLMDPCNHERHSRHFDDQHRIYYAIPFDGQTIWGATAAIIVTLFETLYGVEHKVPPVLSLAQKPWMSAPATRRVIAALEAKGAPARFVGGCVRNALLGLTVADIDIATPEEPQMVVRLLEEAGIHAVPTGLAHGTVTAVADGEPFEITTLRRDVDTDGRHATVAFTRDWEEDAKRRDFTMNAIYAGADGTLYDYVGGLTDLHTRRIRFIGDPAARIAEDYLRILRFFRFHAWYGKGALDPDGLAACAAAKAGLAKLSAERVAQELTRLLEAHNPLSVLPAMKEAGVLGAILPEAEHLDMFGRLVDIEAIVGRPMDWVVRLRALVGPDAAKTAALSARLKLSNEARDRLQRLALETTHIAPDMSEPALHAALYRLGPGLFRELAVLRWVESVRFVYDPRWRTLIAASYTWVPPVFPLTGADVLAAGVKEGPEVGRILSELEEAWIAEDFSAGRAELLARLTAISQAGA